MTIFRFTPKEKEVYREIEKGLQTDKFQIPISYTFSMEKLFHLYFLALGENADKIQYDPTKIHVRTMFGKTILQLDSEFSKREAWSWKKIFDSELQEYEGFKGEPYEILLTVYRNMVKSIKYSNEGKAPYSAFGPIVEKKGICQGISMAFAAIMRKYRIPCAVISGVADTEKESNGPHAWNIVMLEGECYHLDVTWAINDYQKNQKVSYDYFCVTDEDIKLDHRWSNVWYPDCKGKKYNFFIKNGLFVEKETQIYGIVRSQIEKNIGEIYIRLGRKIKSSKMENRLVEAVMEQLKMFHRTDTLKVTWTYNQHMGTAYFLIPKIACDGNTKIRKKKSIKLIQRKLEEEVDAAGEILTIKKYFDGNVEKGNIKFGRAILKKNEKYDILGKYRVLSVLPQWKNGNSHEFEYLKGCFHNSIKSVDDKKCSSVSFFIKREQYPGYPIEEVINIAGQVCINALKQTESVRTIYWVCDEDDLIELCKNFLMKHQIKSV